MADATRPTPGLQGPAVPYRTLVDSIDEGFCVAEMLVDDAGVPTDYRFLEVNRLFGEMTGIMPDAVGRTARDLVPGLEDRWIQIYGRVAIGGESLRFEEGSEAMGRWFDVFAFPAGGRRFGILFRDVTERHRAEAALRESEARLRANEARLMTALAVKDEFLGLVSHELRTPMTVILGMSNILRRDGLTPERTREIATDIAESAEVLSALVDSMLLLARLEQDDAARLREPILLHRVVEAMLEQRRRADPSRTYALEVRTTAALVDVQGSWLERVIDNLVGNAAKYSTPGRPVTAVIELEAGQAVVRVLDEGQGLTQDDLPQVFEPFYRSASARQHAAGAGLGLAVSRRIVELMGGRIWARQRPTGGAEFGFALPVHHEPAD
jgi:signal transduction histidine kinase